MRKIILYIFLAIVVLGCNSKTTNDTELDNLVKALVGEFSNTKQAEEDPTFKHIKMTNIRIWEDRQGYWVYSEQFDANDVSNIYGQRIVNYERVDSTKFKSTSYRLSNAKAYRSGWKDKKMFNRLTIDSLEIREGCQVYFKKNTSTIYSGKTNKSTCSSSFNRIDYITSDFVVSKDKISIWTRGYNEEGKQVWGKITGPFKYQRISKK